MGIKRLSSAVVSALRTDVTVTTTAQCVTELVLNSIDAHATAIAVRVDLKNFRIQVIDNGCGFSVSDLNIVGTRYMTSKCHSLQDLQTNLGNFGFRGEALSSIAEVSGTLTIVSRCRDSEGTFCKIFTGGIGLKVGKSRQQRASCGTTITVADFLYNRPVRRARIKLALDVEDIKMHMESIALINPHVSFSFRNDLNNEMIMLTHRADDIPTVFGTLFGESICANLVSVEEVMGPFKVEGYISNEAHPLKNLQFIYVNKRLLQKTKLHKLVNSLMSRSAILKSNNVPYIPISKEINHGVFLAFSPPKRKKHAIFVLNITCPPSEYDITLDPKKTLVEFCHWDYLLSCFENLLRKFIEKEAGLNVEENNFIDNAPPRKVSNVVDEINELARQQAFGAHVPASMQESICTRNLARALHSLPASRHQVNLSPDVSTGFLTSTVSSELLSSAQDEKDSVVKFSSTVGSVLTEKPYVPFVPDNFSRFNDGAAKTKDSINSAETGISSSVPPGPKYAVEQMNDLFKKPQVSSVLEKKLGKGFLSEPIQFEEEFCKISDEPSKSVNNIDPAMPSPVNALASIKEIRRKKLLNNLNKFSFKSACEKPILNKMLPPVNPHHGKEAKSESNADFDILPKLNPVGTALPNERKSPVNRIQASKAVQTTFTPVRLESDKDLQLMLTQIPTTQSSSRLESTFSITRSSNMNQLHCNSEVSNSHGWENNLNNDVNECGNILVSLNMERNLMVPSDRVHSQDLPSSDAPSDRVHSQDLPSSDALHRGFRNILSVEDMIVTGFDVRCRLPLSQKISNSFQPQPSSSSISTETKKIEEIHSHLNLPFLSREEVVMCDESVSLCPTENSCGEIQCSPLKSANQERLQSESKQVHLKTTYKTSDSIDCNQFICVTSSKPGSNLSEAVKSKPLAQDQKIVDYDSSPPSSQEVTNSFESFVKSNSFSPSKVKRKQDIPCEIMSKKICIPFENSSSEKNILSLGAHAENFNPSLNFVTDFTLCTYSSETGERECLSTNQDGATVGNCVTSTVSAEATSVLDPTFSYSQEKELVPKVHQVVETKMESSTQCSKSLSQNDYESAEIEWVEVLDISGKPFYVHEKSGMTTYQRPSQEKSGTFNFSERFLFLPKGMSPILRDKFTDEPSNSPSISHFNKEEDPSAVKWGEVNSDKKDFWPLVDQLLAEAGNFSENMNLNSQVSNANLRDFSQSDIKFYNVAFPYTFSKDIFQNLRVLGQLDEKFIVTIATLDSTRDVLVLFDQHAVHERIRVENLTEEYRCHDGTAFWKSAPVEPALPLPLSLVEIRILDSYKDKMDRLGFSFNVVDSNTIHILRVPTCLLLRENREVTNRGMSVLRQHLESLIREQVDSLLNTRGVGTDYPTIIRNVISSEACRGAVKFGHSLTIADCQAFLHNLSSCNLPFQCAHGRPALVPIVDLSMVKTKPQHCKPNLHKLKRQLQT